VPAAVKESTRHYGQNIATNDKGTRRRDYGGKRKTTKCISLYIRVPVSDTATKYVITDIQNPEAWLNS
jgi:hypothetical protein